MPKRDLGRRGDSRTAPKFVGTGLAPARESFKTPFEQPQRLPHDFLILWAQHAEPLHFLNPLGNS